MISFILVSEFLYLLLLSKKTSILFLDLHNSYYLFFVVFILLSLFLFYFLFYIFASWNKIPFKHIFIAILLFNLTFIVVPFLTSNDLYSYIFQTRVWSIFGKNPYLISYDSFRYDSFYPVIKTIWSSQTFLQGPLFLVIGGLVNFIGKNNLGFVVFLFKFILVGANILSSYVIYLITRDKKAVFLYGTNPLIIFELAGNAHADSILVLLLLISLYYVSQRDSVKGTLSIFASFLVKYSSLMVFPLEFLYLKKKKLISVLLGALLVFIVYSPFWSGFKIFNYLISYYNGRYISPSVGIAIGEKIFGSYSFSFNLNSVIFVLVSAYLFFKALFSKREFSKLVFYSFIIYFTYLFTKLSLVLPWDLAPLIALASLCVHWKKYRKFGLYGILYTVGYSLFLYYYVR